MDISGALTFLGCSILISFGLAMISAVLLLLNNIFHRFWKPVTLWIVPEYRFVDVPAPNDLANLKKMEEESESKK